MTVNVKAHFDFGDSEALMKAKNLETGGLVQKVIDNAVIKWCEPYCPMKTGVLTASARTATVLGSGQVVYNTPYAHYLYYGEVYGPNIPVFDDDSGIPTRYFSPKGAKKHPTGRPLQYDTSLNPLAGSHWFERMIADHADDILKEAKAVVGVK